MARGNRGWNIVFGKARTALTAGLLGASRDGESSLLFLLLAAAAVVGGTKYYGLW